MNSTLERQFRLLQESTDHILALITPISESEFQRKEPDRWSIGQILIHILTSEKLALQYMKKKSLGVDTLPNSGLIEPVKLTILKISQRLPIKYKVPKLIREKTPDAPRKDEFLLMWQNERQQLRTFLESIPHEHVNKKIFKHPIAGMFNASQGVAFLREHLLHHRPQIVRLTSSLRPQASQVA